MNYYWYDTLGNKFIRQIKDGKFEGQGKMIYVTGEIYEGDWFEGKRHGKGECTF